MVERTSSDAGACDLASRVVERHGGIERWRRATSVGVSFRSGGLAFRLKGQTHALDAVEGSFDTGAQTMRLRAGGAAPWEFAIATADGLVTALEDLHASSLLGRWSSERMGAFAASAMWTYLHVPYVLVDPRVRLKSETARNGLTRLTAQFPAELATHSTVQSFLIDEDHLIRQHDYTAFAFSRLARAAQTLDDYREIDGLLIATRRRVTPRVAGRPAPGPTLVWIQIDDVRVEQ